MAELADATDLGSVTLRGVEVQILSSALQNLGPWPSGKAPALHAGDRRFESGRVHQQNVIGLGRAAIAHRCPSPYSADHNQLTSGCSVMVRSLDLGSVEPLVEGENDG